MTVWRVPHPSVYIREEMEARGWDRDVLAWCMVLGTGKREDALARIAQGAAHEEQSKDWQMTRLALDFFFDVGPAEPAMRMGEMAQQFSRAFGASEDLFVNLEAVWLKDQEAPARAPEGSQ